mmetsp:Transcript_8797/g.16051  ORF Transcript_8797/g.16051 Transcript_8797/m.16051 type:complete len:518 (+) Transcript_8797:78-1631(+)|eukprot:CAMPEP_0201912602 /NCGR_PEP_ID=MMETSP0903-20130614/3219_1 /ASSEMBLY_ACC=CAM_ASM_000552 /TAXON_ID=420261 /ORGANISM="Thalassiosira antarctica, Strain CCMP982" /LENGTH=517 /DNA_ID=CAMNT_0048447591 /DNA_START=10 /DNA_END=1563 /DNA_ORIENTATION=+
MSKQPASSAEAEAEAPSPLEHLHGIDIAQIMTSKGPIVKCVLLRCATEADIIIDPTCDVSSMSIKEIKRELHSYGIDTSSFVEKNELVKALDEARAHLKKPAATLDAAETKIVTQDDVDTKVIVPLQHLIDEMEVDTTPRKSMVSQILGGDFTFLGQYEEEGTMVMIRRPAWELDEDEEEEDDSSGLEEKVRMDDVPPMNPHALQPPLHNVKVRGDILLMRVAETQEELDHDDDDKVDVSNDDGEAKSNTAKEAKAEKIHVPTNDEFFLDYTKEEYLKFAARTDIVAEEVESSSDEESDDGEAEGEDSKPSAASSTAAMLANTTTNDNEDANNSDHDEDFDPDAADNSDSSDSDIEEHQVGMMNMILNHMLRKFREENARGPDSLELLEMRKALADRLGVQVPPVDEEACDWDKKSTATGTPKKKGGKKVVVREEKNETEEIPRRREREGSDDDDDDDCGGERDIVDESVASLKRPAQDHVDDKDRHDQQKQQGSNKRARMNGENENGSSDAKEKKS